MPRPGTPPPSPPYAPELAPLPPPALPPPSLPPNTPPVPVPQAPNLPAPPLSTPPRFPRPISPPPSTPPSSSPWMIPNLPPRRPPPLLPRPSPPCPPVPVMPPRMPSPSPPSPPLPSLPPPSPNPTPPPPPGSLEPTVAPPSPSPPPSAPVLSAPPAALLPLCPPPPSRSPPQIRLSDALLPSAPPHPQLRNPMSPAPSPPATFSVGAGQSLTPHGSGAAVPAWAVVLIVLLAVALLAVVVALCNDKFRHRLRFSSPGCCGTDDDLKGEPSALPAGRFSSCNVVLGTPPPPQAVPSDVAHTQGSPGGSPGGEPCTSDAVRSPPPTRRTPSLVRRPNLANSADARRSKSFSHHSDQTTTLPSRAAAAAMLVRSASSPITDTTSVDASARSSSAAAASSTEAAGRKEDTPPPLIGMCPAVCTMRSSFKNSDRQTSPLPFDSLQSYSQPNRAAAVTFTSKNQLGSSSGLPSGSLASLRPALTRSQSECLSTAHSGRCTREDVYGPSGRSSFGLSTSGSVGASRVLQATACVSLSTDKVEAEKTRARSPSSHRLFRGMRAIQVVSLTEVELRHQLGRVALRREQSAPEAISHRGHAEPIFPQRRASESADYYTHMPTGSTPAVVPSRPEAACEDAPAVTPHLTRQLSRFHPSMASILISPPTSPRSMPVSSDDEGASSSHERR